MKPIYYFTLIILIATGCLKDESKILFSNEKEISNKLNHNLPIIIHASEKIDIRASDIKTSNQLMQRKIEFIDRFSNKIIDSFIISMYQTDTSKSLLTSLKSKEFSGELMIESDNLIPFKIKIEKGFVLPNKINLGGEKNIKPSLVNTCKFNLIHGCVSNEIKNMGIFEYAVCLYGAPECYALLWAGCALNYCMTGEQK